MFESKLFDPLSPLDNLHQNLVRRSTAFRDERITADRVSMSAETGELMIRDGLRRWKCPLQSQALDQIGGKLRIPANYLKRCPPELRARNINHWLEGLGSKELLLRFDNGAVRAVLTSSYTPVAHHEIVERVLRVAEAKNLRLQVRYEWTPTRLLLQVVETGRDLTAVGDTILAGITIVNSETGNASLSVCALLYRLICTNGMTMENTLSFRRIHKRPADMILSEFDEAVGDVWHQLPTLTDPLEALSRLPAPEPMKLLERLARRNGFNELQLEAVEAAFEVEPGETQIYIIHALTRAANDRELSLVDRAQLQGVAGRLLEGAVGSDQNEVLI